MLLAIIFESVGFGEWFILLAVVLIVVGPKNLPSTARKIGQYYAKFRRAAEDAFQVEGDESTAKPLDITQPLQPQIDKAMASDAGASETAPAAEKPTAAEG